MYFKLDESLAHSSSNFLLELAMQMRKYIWISRVVERMKCMSNLTDKFVLGITLFTAQIIVSYLGWQEGKAVKRFIRGKLIYGHLITSSCLVRCWLTNEWHLGASCLLYRNFPFKQMLSKYDHSSNIVTYDQAEGPETSIRTQTAGWYVFGSVAPGNHAFQPARATDRCCHPRQAF